MKISPRSHFLPYKAEKIPKSTTLYEKVPKYADIDKDIDIDIDKDIDIDINIDIENEKKKKI